MSYADTPSFYSPQEEEALLCRVATQHDLAESFQLRSTTGWQTLQAILQSTGERIPKRARADFGTDADDRASSLHGHPAPPTPASRLSDTDERLAKRIAAVRLAGDRQSPGRRAVSYTHLTLPTKA